MKSRKLSVYLLISASLLAVAHNFAIQHGWYLRYPHIDIFMHLLGGVILALIVFAIVLPQVDSVSISPEMIFGGVLFFTAIIAVGWEVFESMFALTDDAGLSAETISDIMFGIVGGMVGWSIGSSITKPHKL